MSFVVFAGTHNYSNGGWRDCVGVYPNLTNAHLAVIQIELETKRFYGAERPDGVEHRDWWHIVDLASGQIMGEAEFEPAASKTEPDRWIYPDRPEWGVA